MNNDIKATIAGLVAGIAYIAKVLGFDIPPEVLDAITGLGVIFLGFYANRKETTKKTDATTTASAVALVLALSLTIPIAMTGCATTGTVTSPDSVSASVQTATKTLLTIGTAVKAIPQTADALYAAQKIDDDQYNQIATGYNQAKSAYFLAVDAEVLALQVSATPADQTAFVRAVTTAFTALQDVQALITAFGGK